MASCQKCGRGHIRKRKDGRRKCRRCGYLPGQYGVILRSGHLKPGAIDPALINQEMA